MKYLLFIFFISGCAVSLGSGNTADKKEIQCKEITFKVSCNTCTGTMCTDGKNQWTNGYGACTAKYCDDHF